jgi:uncharacterized oxidoreductase
MPAEVLVAEAPLKAVVEAIFAAAGCGPRECRLVADHLVEANLRGHDSHGVGMIPAYAENLRAGELDLAATLSVEVDTGQLLVCDGRLGLGQVIAHDAVALAIGRARQAGTCILGLRNAHHIGRIGHWAEQCAAAGLVSIHFVNVISDPVVAPFGGKAGRIVTNPFSAGIPRENAPPVIVDFATSRLAAGKVRVAYNKGVPLPDGVLLDGAGEPTTDPAALFEADAEGRIGAILPFGEHKGWGLALACELIAGALTGGGTQSGPRKRPAIVNNMLSVLIAPDALGTRERFQADMEAFIAWARSAPSDDPAGVRIAGDPERASKALRGRDGIPVDATTWEQILAAGDSVGADRSHLLRLAEIS